jgi:zinc transport system substrate-binding protein
MYKIIIILIISSVFTLAKLNIAVSILPQKIFLEEIAGDKINVTLMVKAGNSPHTYEPKPSQMIEISNTSIYFSIGVEFENIWLSKFKNQNRSMKIENITKDILKIKMVKKDNNHNHRHDEKDKLLDPHIWTSALNVKIIANNIYNILIKYDKKNKQYYKNNLDKFIVKIDNTHKKIKNILKDSKNNKFMVFHPSWGYFAKEYNLKQIPIEISGKKPKPKELLKLIKKARAENIKVIFVSPEFSDKIANTIAKELNIKVKKVSPLNPNWSQNLIDLAKEIKF